MDVFTMVVIIVAVSCVAGVANNYLKNQRHRDRNAADEGRIAELDELRERIEVLEKIVTDEKYTLNREINDLERNPAG